MITDDRLEQLKQKINVFDGNDYIKITEDFFKDSSNFPSGWCCVKFFNEPTMIDGGWVNQNGEYLTGERKFFNVDDFKNGVAEVRAGYKYYYVNTFGFWFNTDDRKTAEEINEEILNILNKYFPKHSMKLFIFKNTLS